MAKADDIKMKVTLELSDELRAALDEARELSKRLDASLAQLARVDRKDAAASQAAEEFHTKLVRIVEPERPDVSAVLRREVGGP